MPLFTRETAAIAGQLGAKARWSKPKAESNDDPPPPSPAIVPKTTDSFTADRLLRVRKQLDRIDQLASKETEPKLLKEYAEACARLSEQERILAGRPLPGSLKQSGPGKAITSRSHDYAAPWVPTIAPAPEPVQPPAPAKPMGWEYDL